MTGLLRDLQLNVEQVAVELNLEILDKQDFDVRMLQEGDRVEIMSFIGGGAPPFVNIKKMKATSSRVGVQDGERQCMMIV